MSLSDHIGEIAKRILGQPNKALSTRSQLRFGTNGSVAVDIDGTKAGTWFDHESGKGGGWQDFLCIKGGIADTDISDWLEREGFGPVKPNGHGRSKSKIVAIYDYHDETGALLFQVCRQYPPKKFFQRAPDGKGGWKRDKDGKLTMRGTRMVPYRLPELVAAAGRANGTPWRAYIVEGEKDADRLQSQWGLTATCNPGGAGKWRSDYNRYFAGADVVVMPDNDDVGHQHARDIAQNLATVAANVRIVKLGGLPEKGDISDWMDDGSTQSDFETLIELTEAFEPEEAAAPSDDAGDLPVIIVEPGKRHIAADQGISALVSAQAPFYQRNRKIVRIALVKAKTSSGETIWVPGIISVEQAMMERELGRSAVWQRYDARKKGYAAIDPPSQVAAQILSMAGYWPFPPLYGIIQCPTLRRDGTLLDQPGYDETTGLVLVGNAEMPAVSMRPSREEAETALALLLGLLTEFPFVDDESRSVALSMFITPVIRGALTVAPMHLVTAPLPGSGKSYLLDCASMIATGERCAVEAMAPKYEETEKRLIGAALSGFPIIGVDNVREIVAGDFFCQIVERPLMSLRALGSSDKHRIPNNFTVFADGNNAAVAEDMIRRTIRSGLDANVEHPEERRFAFDPLAAIAKNRGRYIAAALTIPLAYIAAGRPNPKTPLPSFTEWSRMIRDPLIWLGCTDPVATQAKLRDADPRKTDKTALFEAWKAVGVGKSWGLTTKDLIEKADEHPSLWAALFTIAPQRFTAERKIDPRELGKWLTKQEGTIASSCKLISDRTNAARPKWYLEPMQGK